MKPFAPKTSFKFKKKTIPISSKNPMNEEIFDEELNEKARTLEYFLMNVNKKNASYRERDSSQDKKKSSSKKSNESIFMKEPRGRKKKLESYAWLFKLRNKYIEDLEKVDDDKIKYEYREKIRQITLELKRLESYEIEIKSNEKKEEKPQKIPTHVEICCKIMSDQMRS